MLQLLGEIQNESSYNCLLIAGGFPPNNLVLSLLSKCLFFDGKDCIFQTKTICMTFMCLCLNMYCHLKSMEFGWTHRTMLYGNL